MGRDVEGNPDVLVESLATQVAVECFELVLGRPQRGLRRALHRPATPEKRRATITSALDRLQSTIQLVRGTQPYEFESAVLAENLRDLVGMAAWLSEADDAVLSTLQRRSVSWDGTAVEMDSSAHRCRAPTTTTPSFRRWCATLIERSSIFPKPSRV